MTKGGGKPKGRPKKIGNVIPPPQLNVSIPREEAKCSYAAALSSEVAGGETATTPIELEFLSTVGPTEDMGRSEAVKEATAKKVEEGEAPPMRKRGIALGYVRPVLK